MSKQTLKLEVEWDFGFLQRTANIPLNLKIQCLWYLVHEVSYGGSALAINSNLATERNGYIIVNRCKFYNTTSAKEGGAINFYSSKKISITDCTFEKTESKKDAHSIQVKGEDIEIISSKFINCSKILILMLQL
ncbi:hypothetical protein M9Y10_026336 [Tritrichomonas musculus]|uniref:Right handed beta helix domain-containing protein n=1 Tax=Tritrichomonas musculus TaxID=1915356 RepID=A0ABR2H7B1_9EUKA